MIAKSSAVVANYKSHAEAEAAVKELQYETALKTGQFVVIAHATAEEASRAREIIHRTNPEARVAGA
jgi:hypothetical protein